MTRAAFDHLLAAARDWHAAIRALSEFIPWPEDLTYQPRDPAALPMIPHLTANPGSASALSRPLRDAIIAAAPHIEWRLTYTEAEVGRDFVTRYGWFELAGPEGHFRTESARLTVGYWGPHLDYGRHQHRAEELYSIVSGSADFHMDDAGSEKLGPGDTRFHPSDHPHAMTTTDDPVLTFVLWRGEGLADPPRMSVP